MYAHITYHIRTQTMTSTHIRKYIARTSCLPMRLIVINGNTIECKQMDPNECEIALQKAFAGRPLVISSELSSHHEQEVVAAMTLTIVAKTMDVQMLETKKKKSAKIFFTLSPVPIVWSQKPADRIAQAETYDQQKP